MILKGFKLLLTNQLQKQEKFKVEPNTFLKYLVVRFSKLFKIEKTWNSSVKFS